MDEEEQLLWVAVYTAATTARYEDPGMKADSAVIRYRSSQIMFSEGPDPTPPEPDLPF